MSTSPHFPALVITTDLERRALAIWNRTQAAYPAFTRRPPDIVDLHTGAWARFVAEAAREAQAAVAVAGQVTPAQLSLFGG